MRNQQFNLHRYIAYIEIILSLLGKEEKTGYIIAKEYGKYNEQQRYRNFYLPKLYDIGLLNKREEKKKKRVDTYYSLNFVKFWDLFFDFFSKNIKRKPNEEEMVYLTNFLTHPNILNNIRSKLKENLQKFTIYILFYEIFLGLNFMHTQLNAVYQYKKSQGKSQRGGFRGSVKTFDKFVEEKYNLQDMKDFRETMVKVYDKVLKNILKELF